MTTGTRIVMALGVLGLAACGGGSPPGSDTTPPASAVTAPSITAQPEARVVTVGQSATFSVIAVGSGLTYAWQRDGAAIDGATSETYTTPPTSTVDDRARFTVVVTNAGGSVTSASAELRVQGFADAAPMAAARQSHAATALPDGKVLVSGGFAVHPLATAELYDPATGAFSATGDLFAARQHHTATLLPNGKVLVAGGEGGTGGGLPLATAELYDPATGLFSAAGAMTAARTLHTATLLSDGKVLVAGGLGSHAAASVLAGAEIYDPATNRFTAAAHPMAAARYAHAAVLLPGGKVLVAGGYGAGGGALDGAELFDPAAGAFTATGPMTAARYSHSATLLPGGEVLVAGGYGAGFLASAELYDPAAGAFAATHALGASRYAHAATALAGGQVLLVGGLGPSGPLAGAELYDPATASFTVSGPLGVARYLHTATLLPSGEVLVAGGWSLSDMGLSSAERYSGAP
jgi:hypothetical protein